MNKYIVILCLLCVVDIVSWGWSLIISPLYTIMLFAALVFALLAKKKKWYDAIGMTIFSPTLILQLLVHYNMKHGSFTRLVLNLSYISSVIAYMLWSYDGAPMLIATAWGTITMTLLLEILVPAYFVRLDKL